MKEQLTLLSIGLDPSPVSSWIGDKSNRLRGQGQFMKEVFYICRPPTHKKPVKLADNVMVYPTKPLARLLYPFYAYRKASKIIKENKIDVMYTQDPFLCGLAGYMIKKRYGIPWVIGMHSDILDNPYWLKEEKFYPILNMLGKKLVKRCDSIRAVSGQIKKKLVSLGVPEEKIVVAPTGGGIDMNAFAKADGSEVRKKYTGKEIILFVGRMAKAKNLDMLLVVAQLMKDRRPRALFLMVGGGPEKPRLEAEAKELGLTNIKFVGHLPFEELPNYYDACDVAILTSFYEGFPKTVEEAFAAGKPFVSTGVSGATDMIIDGKTGYLADIDRSKDFADKLDKLLSDKPAMKKMGQQAKKIALEKYDRKKNFAKYYLDFYNRAIKFA